METTISNIPSEIKNNFFKKWNHYQKVRFPILAHGILILAFSFSAISFAMLSTGETNFISRATFLPGLFIVFTTFLLLRIADEFKDAEDDKKYRPELPVPSGIIKLSELKYLALIILGLQLMVHIVFLPKMIWLYIVVMAYLGLMTKEFFIPEWLRKNQLWYVVSHMMIIPLVDIYASGLYWNIGDIAPPKTLILFFLVSFFNGLVLELGRKIRAPHQESEGVETYSAKLGGSKATKLWLLMLFVTFAFAALSIWFATQHLLSIMILIIVWIVTSIIGIVFMKNQNEKTSKRIEIASGIWAILMYILLGGIPMLSNLLS